MTSISYLKNLFSDILFCERKSLWQDTYKRRKISVVFCNGGVFGQSVEKTNFVKKITSKIRKKRQICNCTKNNKI